MSQVQRCTVNRSWLVKMLIFAAILLGFGCWALADGFWLYPRRGLADASVKLRDFLSSADKAGRLTQQTITTSDPGARLKELKAKEDELRTAARGETSDARKAAMDVSQLEWLESLSRAWRLSAAEKPLGTTSAKSTGVARTLVFNPGVGEGSVTPAGGAKTALTPQALLNELNNYWSEAKQPSPLSGFDMPVQFIFMVVGFGWGLYLVWLILKTKALANRYTWEPETKKLSTPDGFSVTPGTLDDLDKRKWHKFYVTLITSAGQKELDLLRFDPLEQWILELERTRFPDRAAAAAETGEAEAPKT